MDRSRLVVCLMLISLLSLVGCGSGRSSQGARLISPEFRIRQLPGQVPYSRNIHVGTTASINLLVDVFNRSSEEIVLKRIQIQSMGGGAYRFDPTSRIFNERIAPSSVVTVDLWVTGQSESISVDSSAPVSLRGTALFDSDGGQFREVFVRPIEDRQERAPRN